MRQYLMRTVFGVCLTAVFPSCGVSGVAGAQEPGDLKERVERILAGEGTARGEAACEVLESGVLAEVFGAEEEAWSFRPGSKYVPHPLCSAFRDKPDGAELDAAAARYEQQKAMARVKGEAFDEPKPPASQYQVSLTILDQAFDSPADAVASLESAVAALAEGVTVEVGGEDHTARADFDGWVQGVGDKAAWAPRLNELQVADAGVRYAVMVSGFDADENKAKAIELARRIAAP